MSLFDKCRRTTFGELRMTKGQMRHMVRSCILRRSLSLVLRAMQMRRWSRM